MPIPRSTGNGVKCISNDTVAAQGRPINYGASVDWATARIDTLLGSAPVEDENWLEREFAGSKWQQAIASPKELAGIAQRITEGLDERGLGVGFLPGYAPGTGAHTHIVHINSISLRDIGAAMFRQENWQARVGGIGAGNVDVDGQRLTEAEPVMLTLRAHGVWL